MLHMNTHIRNKKFYSSYNRCSSSLSESFINFMVDINNMLWFFLKYRNGNRENSVLSFRLRYYRDKGDLICL